MVLPAEQMKLPYTISKAIGLYLSVLSSFLLAVALQGLIFPMSFQLEIIFN